MNQFCKQFKRHYTCKSQKATKSKQTNKQVAKTVGKITSTGFVYGNFDRLTIKYLGAQIKVFWGSKK